MTADWSVSGISLVDGDLVSAPGAADRGSGNRLSMCRHPCGPQRETVLHALKRAAAHREATTALLLPRITTHCSGVHEDIFFFVIQVQSPFFQAMYSVIWQDPMAAVFTRTSIVAPAANISVVERSVITRPAVAVN